jgi:hypothetical protein
MLYESHIDSHTSPSLRCAKRTHKGGGRRGNRRFPYREGVVGETVGFPTARYILTHPET